MVPYFRFLQGAHESGTRFLLRTTRYGPSGDCMPLLDVVVADGGVGVMLAVEGQSTQGFF